LRTIYFVKNLKGKGGFRALSHGFIFNPVYLISLLLYAGLFLFAGDRGPVLRIVLVFIGAYAIFLNPISIKTLSVFIVVGALMFSIVGMGRVRDVGDLEGANLFVRGYGEMVESGDFNITNELATSNRILFMALDMVPGRHSYLYGSTYLLNITGVVPFLTGIIVDFASIPREYRGTAQFFTVASLGRDSTVGVGSEIISDIYVNFGIFGVFLIMALFGRISALIQLKSSHGNHVFVIISLILLSEALSMNRGMLLYPLKSISYTLLVNYLVSKLRIGK